MTNNLLSCTMIVRDEASTLSPLLETVRPLVDELVIVDTGSSDNTPDIAEAFADVFDTYSGCNDPETGLIEDFAAARNYAASLAECDFMVWVDGDDEVERFEHFAMAIAAGGHEGKLRRWVAPYEYNFDDHGRCMLFQARERMVYPRRAFRWISPVHEMLLPIEGQHEDLLIPEVIYRHRADHSRKPRELGRNLRILHKYVARVGEDDPRAIFYVGREHDRFGDVGTAARFYRRTTELAGADETKCQAMLALCRIFRDWGALPESLEWGMRAMATKGWQEPYFEVAKTCLAFAEAGERRDYNLRRAAQFIPVGLNLRTEAEYGFDPRERFAIHDQLSRALELLGDVDGALESAEMGLAGLPDHIELRKRQSRLRERKLRESVQSGIDELERLGAVPLGAAKVAKSALAGAFDVRLLRAPPGDTVPPEALDKEHADADTERPPATETPSGLDIVFYTGEAYAPWNPETIARSGMGGSETMACELAKRLHARGHRVRVFGHLTRDMEGTFDGVEYRDRLKFPGTRADVLISSRYPEAVDDRLGVTATVRLLWLHDVSAGDRLTPELEERYDRILTLSGWHTDHVLRVYPWLTIERIWQTRNGIDLARFPAGIERNPKRAIWSSSPDRGLIVGLESWPIVKKVVPEAELHIYYGFESWEDSARYRGDEMEIRNVAILRRLMNRLDGVHYHGRVNGQELARAMLGAGVWYYPTDFTETFCIGAAEAQAAGLRIVTSDLAALTETVGMRGVRLSERWRTPDYRVAFAREVVDAMLAPDEGDRAESQAFALERFDVETLADEWDAKIREMFEAKKEAPFEAYRKAAE